MGRPILYKTSKEFLLRFGLSDLEELPSLKEFEALAREALGSDEGLAPTDESLTSEASISAPAVENRASAEMEAREELLEETAANNEGMPEGESKDSQKAATVGERRRKFNTEITEVGAQRARRRERPNVVSMGGSQTRRP